MRTRRGIVTIEFALAAPLLLLILAGVLDYALLLRTAACIADAARSGAQYGALSLANSSDTAGMQAAALNSSPGVAGMTAAASRACQCPDGSSVSCTGSCPSGKVATYVQVTVRATAHPIFSYAPLSYPGSLSYTAKMRAQ